MKTWMDKSPISFTFPLISEAKFVTGRGSANSMRIAVAYSRLILFACVLLGSVFMLCR